jgi:hypothetical protein
MSLKTLIKSMYFTALIFHISCKKPKLNKSNIKGYNAPFNSSTLESKAKLNQNKNTTH